MFVDTHCHLNFKDFDKDLAMVIGNAKKVGVKKFIVPGVNIYSSQKTINLTQKYPGVIYASIGIHPYEAQHTENLRSIEMLLSTNHKYIDSKTNLQESNIVAIGECGLDYHLYKGEPALGKKDKQKRLFEEHLLLSLKYKLPVIMHCRDAFPDLFSVIDSLPQLPHGVIHCFSGGLEDVRQAHNRKLYIGIDGNITYSKQMQTIMPQIPDEMIILETDAPHLTPIPFRGKRNEPKYMPIIAKKISVLKEKSVSIIADITSKNAYSLFQFS